MLQKISGSVESIRSIAVTSVHGTSSNVGSSTRHETSVRVGGTAVQMRTGSLVNIHPGDSLNVAVWRIFGTHRAVAWHVVSTGARGTIGVKELVVLTAIGLVGVLMGLANRSGLAVVLGLAALAAAGAMAVVQSKARRLVD